MTTVPQSGISIDTSQTETLIVQINDLIREMGQRLADGDDYEHQWMAEHCQNPEAVALLPDMTVGMLHVLDAIGRLEPVNGITISKQYGIPKGSVSKVTRKLAAKNLIVTETLPNNKKEILFRMTRLGQEIFEVHRAMHLEMEQRMSEFLRRYSADELRFIAKIIQDFGQMRWFAQQDING
jgi:DNA-binding MarR family transcriptional regulator